LIVLDVNFGGSSSRFNVIDVCLSIIQYVRSGVSVISEREAKCWNTQKRD